MADPFRHPADGVASLPNPVGSPFDKALVGLFRIKALLKSPADILQAPETSTLSRLQVPTQHALRDFCISKRLCQQSVCSIYLSLWVTDRKQCLRDS